MRFRVGQTYECSEDGRQAMVAEVRAGGREGRLRFLDDGHQEWFLWAQLHEFGKWKLIGS